MTVARCTRDDFLGRVQLRAGLGSRHQAERTTKATLSTLRDAVGPGARRIAEELPIEIGQVLQRSDGSLYTAQRVGLGEFLDRVSRRGAIPSDNAAGQAKAVLDVVKEIVSQQSFAIIRAKLQGDLKSLLADPHEVTTAWEA